MTTTVAIVVVVLLALFVIITVAKAIMVVPQAQSAVIERLGRFRTVASPGLTFLVPFLDKVRARIDLREQVVSFPPQPVITEDNLTVSIDTVVYFQVTDSRAAVYEISNYIVGVEQLTTTTLRNVVGGMSLEQTLTSRDSINTQLRGVLDEATGRWGIRVGRVELKAIDPPPSIQDSMEKQMRADREKRAMILTAEGQRESAIKTAEGQKQSQILSAEGARQATILAAEAERQSRILRAQGERAARYLQAQGQAKAIEKVFAAIKAGRPTPEVLAYQYLQTLPQMAQGDANKVWMIPSDYGKALEGFARALGAPGDDGVFRYEPPKDDTVPDKVDLEDEEVASWFETKSDPKVAEAVAAAEAVARQEVPALGTPSAPPARPSIPRPVQQQPELEADEDRGTEVAPAPQQPQPLQNPPTPQSGQPLPQPQQPAGPPQGGQYQGPPPQSPPPGQFGGPQNPGSGPFPQQPPFGGPRR
ncbi:Regulator of protease activity HflC, stomatin/prohibitin superfamily [Amycolatopsis pretoriensis]|uniref:Regulator of protease activity HflC, stomatin/prohibitin superfamily n=2 Tax=Amycolatopsis pretoriensis TaxID=218821 RepID=A0A1H5Q7G8_9PSEU|nr:Regulator of protease activity HflC, stomatin/prohibitin superfamily [Amycolatopsis pretoriensis]